MSKASVRVKQELLRALQAEPTAGALRTRYRMINALHPAEIATLLESLPTTLRKIAWEFIDPELEGDVLIELSESVRSSFVREMSVQELLAAIEGMQADDLADLVGELPMRLTTPLLQAMSERDRARLRPLLSFPEHTAGGLMNTDTVSVRPDVTAQVVLAYLRMRRALPDRTDCLFVVDRGDSYIGAVSLTRLISEAPDRLIGEMLRAEAPRFDPNTPARDVAQTFRDLDLISAPVVSEQGKLLGRITVDDVVDVIREEADHAVLSMGGLPAGDDIFASTQTSLGRRLPWLAIGAASGLTAGLVIRTFEHTIERAGLLAVLMPIVASMGGIAGTQTVTLVVRGLARGQIRRTNARWVFIKEFAVGALTGTILSAALGVLAAIWISQIQIAAVVAGAMFITLLAAGFLGAAIPLLLYRLRIDPALGAAVLLTTCTDIIGFATLLGIATLVLF